MIEDVGSIEEDEEEEDDTLDDVRKDGTILSDGCIEGRSVESIYGCMEGRSVDRWLY